MAGKSKLFKDHRTPWHLLALYDSVRTLTGIQDWREKYDSKKHLPIQYCNFFPMVQLMSHGLEIGLKWCYLEDTGTVAPKDHNLHVLWQKLEKDRGNSIDDFYQCHSTENPTPPIEEVLNFYGNWSIGNRYIMEDENWNKWINMRCDMHNHGAPTDVALFDVMRAVVHEACRISIDKHSREEPLLVPPDDRTSAHGQYRQTGPFLLINDARALHFDYSELLGDLINFPQGIQES